MKLPASFFLIIGLIPNLLAAAEESVAAESGLSLWGLLKQGGWAMYPLGLASLVMLFLIFYCYHETNRKKFIPDALLPELSQLLLQRDLYGANAQLQNSQTALTRALSSALSRARIDLPNANKPIIEDSLAESLEHEENNVGQWINYLNVVANIAPMIGLLGTVSGMIGAFQTISHGGMGRPELLAGDIGEALITTATGLIIGIPAMISYFILRNRLDNRMLAVGQTASLLVDQLAGEITESESAEEEAPIADEMTPASLSPSQ